MKPKGELSIGGAKICPGCRLLAWACQNRGSPYFGTPQMRSFTYFFYGDIMDLIMPVASDH